MSIQVMSAVWERSTAYGGELLIMLAIANYADINGRAFPSIRTLAVDGRMTERNAQYCIQKLEALGEIKVDRNAGPHGTHIFQVLLQGESFSGCKVFTHKKKRSRNKALTSETGEKISGVKTIQTETHFTGGVKPISPEPSLDPSVKEKDLTPDTADAVSTPSTNTKPTHRRKSNRQDTIPEWSEALPWPQPLSLIALYHALKPEDWAAIEIVTEARLKKYRDYLAQFPTQGFWERVFSALHEPSWLRDNLSPQLRTLDWLLQKGRKDGIENCAKVAEGSYAKNHARASPYTLRPTREPVVDDLGPDVQDGEF